MKRAVTQLINYNLRLSSFTSRSLLNIPKHYIPCQSISTSNLIKSGQVIKENVSKHKIKQIQTNPQISKVEIEHGTSAVKIWWEGKHYHPEGCVYPFVWLRDNCQCSSCFDQSAYSRSILMKDLDVNIKPTAINNDKDNLNITWPDGHITKLSSDWLFKRAFHQMQQLQRLQQYRIERTYWDSELIKDLPRVEFNDILQNDSSLLTWLRLLEEYGLVIVGGAPTTGGQVTQLAERIAFIKKTHYGGQFDVIAKPNPSNVAYSTGDLHLHTDLPYYEYKPGVQFIHCLIQYQGLGGESLVTDGVHVAKELKRLHPEKYNLLKDVLVDWFDIGSDLGGTFHKMLRQPVLCEDKSGEICRINLSQAQRDSFFNIDVDKVALWYDAMKTFHDMLHDPANCITFKMIPGTIMTFDNIRIVHGRLGFTGAFGERHLQGCYVDWDEVRSRRRVLEMTT